VVGGKSTKVFEGNQAGQAYQGVEGSSEIDVTASIEDAEPGKSLVLEPLCELIDDEMYKTLLKETQEQHCTKVDISL